MTTVLMAIAGFLSIAGIMAVGVIIGGPHSRVLWWERWTRLLVMNLNDVNQSSKRMMKRNVEDPDNTNSKRTLLYCGWDVQEPTGQRSNYEVEPPVNPPANQVLNRPGLVNV